MYKVLVKVLGLNKKLNIKVKADNKAAATVAVLRLLLQKKIYVKLIQTVSC
jgi:hypothetical protein